MLTRGSWQLVNPNPVLSARVPPVGSMPSRVYALQIQRLNLRTLANIRADKACHKAQKDTVISAWNPLDPESTVPQILESPRVVGPGSVGEGVNAIETVNLPKPLASKTTEPGEPQISQ